MLRVIVNCKIPTSMIILRDSQNAYAIWLVRGDIGRSRSYWVRYQERDVQDFLMLELKSRVISWETFGVRSWLVLIVLVGELSIQINQF